MEEQKYDFFRNAATSQANWLALFDTLIYNKKSPMA